MKYLKLETVALVIALFILVFSITGAAKTYVIGDQKTPVVIPAEGATYVGADECKTCHLEKYNDWKTSGHPYKIMTPDEALAIRPDLPMPDGYTKDEILYVIGSWGWKARYIGTDGYIITKTGEDHDIDGSNQYNIATGEWVDYHAGEQYQFNCQRCHNTGASYDEVNDLPGIDGTWEFNGVQCEACHGPGSVHIEETTKETIIVDTSSAQCGLCHRRGAANDKIPASGNFVQHHEQYLDFLSAGKMSSLDCVDCHDPHKPVHVGATNPVEGAGIIKQCSECHATDAETYESSVMGVVGVTCVECHMPRASKSAVEVSEFEADVRSHLFKINTDVNAEFIYTDPDDGKQYANPYITVEYACLYCHDDMDKAWAAENSPGIMSLQPEVMEEPEPELIDEEEEPTEAAPETETPGFGLLAAFVAIVLIGYVAKKR